ncbi:MAG: hypothetical protein IPI68_11520 [Chitinophagaceae bacterium]|nr:hypothetical protein [Chitinophagaceae bacterium]
MKKLRKGNENDLLSSNQLKVQMKYRFLVILALLSLCSAGQISPTLTVPSGHKGLVRNCYFTPNDKYLVSTDEDHVLCIWDGDDGRQLFTLRDSAASFRKVQINNATTFITALTDSGRLYIIDFGTLKIKAIQDSVTDYSLHQKEEIIFLIKSYSTIYKYNPKNYALKKIRYSTTLSPVSIIALSQTEACVQDETKGVFIINEVTGKALPLVTSRTSNLRLHDYHPETGYLLCTDFNSSGGNLTYYNIEAKSRSVKGQIALQGQYRNPQCIYTADNKIFIAANLSEDPDGMMATEPVSLYSFKTGREIKKLGSEYVSDLGEMNLNFSRSSLVAEKMPDFENQLFFRFNFLQNSVDIAMGKKYDSEDKLKFACANSSKKIAIFNKALLLPGIYPDGVAGWEGLKGIKKYSELNINLFPVTSVASGDKNERKIGFLFSEETALNDSVVFTTAPYDLSNNLYAGILYYMKNGFAADSLKFSFEYMANPSPGSNKLFWSRENNFYALDIASRTITDSLTFLPRVIIRNIRQAGGNVLITREDSLANPQYGILRYNIFQKKIIDTAFYYGGDFFKPYDEINYAHHTEGLFPDLAVKDYDYIHNTLFEYPFFYGRVDSVAVLDSVGEISSYQAVQQVPYLKIISDTDSPDANELDIIDKVENFRIQQVRYWDNNCYLVMSSQNKIFLYSLSQDSVLKKIYCVTDIYSKLFTLKNKQILVSNKNRNDVYVIDIDLGKIIAHLNGYFNPVILQPDGLLLLQDAASGSYNVYNEKN